MQNILRGLGRHGDIRVLCNDSFGKNAIMTCRRAARSRSTATQCSPRCYPGMILAQHFDIAGKLVWSHRTRQYRYGTQRKTEVASCS
jgi:ribosomal protein S27AE